MNARSDCEAIPLGDADGSRAVVEIFANGEHRAHARATRPRDDGLTVGVELLVLEMTMRVDQTGASILGKREAAGAIRTPASSPPHDANEIVQSSSIRPGLPSCRHISSIRSGITG